MPFPTRPFDRRLTTSETGAELLSVHVATAFAIVLLSILRSFRSAAPRLVSDTLPIIGAMDLNRLATLAIDPLTP